MQERKKTQIAGLLENITIHSQWIDFLDWNFAFTTSLFTFINNHQSWTLSDPVLCMIFYNHWMHYSCIFFIQWCVLFNADIKCDIMYFPILEYYVILQSVYCKKLML